MTKKIGEASEATCTKEAKVSKLKTQYAQLDDVIETYQKILKGKGLPRDGIKEKTMDALDELSKHGLLIYFRDNPRLQKIVFNDINTFVNIIKCIFHHETETFLNYDENTELVIKHYKLVNAKEKFEKDVELLHDEGLMTKPLVAFLLEKNNCRLDPEDVMELLSEVEVGHYFQYQKERSTTQEGVLFIPFFIRQDINVNISEEFKTIDLSDEMNLSVTCEVTGDFKEAFLHYLFVKLYEEFLPKRDTQYRKVWCSGFCATVGRCGAKVCLSMLNEETITFTVKANVATSEGHRIIWNYINIFNNSFDSISRRWCHGMPRTKHVRCSHCNIQQQQLKKLKAKSNPKVPTLHKWDMALAIHGDNTEICYCNSLSEGVPVSAALVQPLSKDDEIAKKQLQDLHMYLKTHCSCAVERSGHATEIQSTLKWKSSESTSPEMKSANVSQNKELCILLSAIRIHCHEWIPNLQYQEVMMALYSKWCVSSREKEQLDRELENKGPSRATEMLLDLLEEKAEPQLQDFVGVLKEKQPTVYGQMCSTMDKIRMGKLSTMISKQDIMYTAIRRQAEHLTASLQNSDITARLFAISCLEQSEKELLDQQLTYKGQIKANQKLLKFLEPKTEAQLHKFMKVLEEFYPETHHLLDEAMDQVKSCEIPVMVAPR